MSKVITFSRHFQKGHPRAGQNTNFVEQILNSFNVDAFGKKFFIDFEETMYQLNRQVPYDVFMDFRDSLVKTRTTTLGSKGHTIRSGKRWKVGDNFSPRVWSGKPYCSNMIQFAPDIEIKKIWDIDIMFISPDRFLLGLNGEWIEFKTWEEIAKNDGLSLDDFKSWLIEPVRKTKTFSGQVICWDEKINY